MFESLAKSDIERNYEQAVAQYAALGVDADAALTTLAATPVSLHC